MVNGNSEYSSIESMQRITRAKRAADDSENDAEMSRQAQGELHYAWESGDVTMEHVAYAMVKARTAWHSAKTAFEAAHAAFDAGVL